MPMKMEYTFYVKKLLSGKLYWEGKCNNFHRHFVRLIRLTRRGEAGKTRSIHSFSHIRTNFIAFYWLQNFSNAMFDFLNWSQLLYQMFQYYGV